ncbi:MAG: hypothetical protein NTW04_02795 [Elusimicrobia bacterium]|nr:hypothetical protein [Elusimicrobiota bacterium]
MASNNLQINAGRNEPALFSRVRFLIFSAAAVALIYGISFGRSIKPIIYEPVPLQAPPNEKAADPDMPDFLQSYEKSITSPAKPEISANIKSLNLFTGKNKEILIRHLASSAKWRLTEEAGKLYACRRIVTPGGRWRASRDCYHQRGDMFSVGMVEYIPGGKNGYSTRKVNAELPGDFSFRVILGLDGPVLSLPLQKKFTLAKAGSGVIPLKLEEVSSRKNSYLTLISQGPSVEIFESRYPESRPFTEWELSAIEKELSNLADSAEAKEKGFDRRLLPEGSIKRGWPQMQITGSGGIYQLYGYVNPGEPGFVYTCVKHNSADKGWGTVFPDIISKSSVEYTGWSADPQEKFLYNAEIIIHEQDPGETLVILLNFVPANGGPQRLIQSEFFKLEGWKDRDTTNLRFPPWY